MTTALDVLDDYLDEHETGLVAFRRMLHAHPERSGEEHATTEAVAERLLLAGLAPTTLRSGTGLVCDVVGDPGPVVVLRADIDALAMPDLSTTPYRSQVPGLAHACGHDVHTAVVLGAGLALARLAASGALPGTVRLVFEPSEEEVPGGAVEVVESGHLDGVSGVFGLHCDPKTDVGLIGVRPGALTSASDRVEIVLRGPGGHTARPERTVDLVRLAATVVHELPPMLDAHFGSHGDLRLVFGAVHGGEAANVIPSEIALAGSLRTQRREAWDAAERTLRACLGRLVDGTGAQWHLVHTRGVPPVVNDEAATAVLASAARDVLDAEAVVPTEHSWGGDSFAWYLDRAPGSYARLGVHDPRSSGPRLDLHASTFDVDERAIGVGVRVLVATALRWLAHVRELTAPD